MQLRLLPVILLAYAVAAASQKDTVSNTRQNELSDVSKDSTVESNQSSSSQATTKETPDTTTKETPDTTTKETPDSTTKETPDTTTKETPDTTTKETPDTTTKETPDTTTKETPDSTTKETPDTTTTQTPDTTTQTPDTTTKQTPDTTTTQTPDTTTTQTPDTTTQTPDTTTKQTPDTTTTQTPDTTTTQTPDTTTQTPDTTTKQTPDTTTTQTPDTTTTQTPDTTTEKSAEGTTEAPKGWGEYPIHVGGDDTKPPCIFSKMNVSVKVTYQTKDSKNDTATVFIPETAKASGSCSDTQSIMTLSWTYTDMFKNRYIRSFYDVYAAEENNITFYFKKDNSKITVDQIDLAIILDEKHFPNAQDPRLTTTVGKNLDLFATSAQGSKYVCNTETVISTEGVQLSITDVSLIAFNEDKDITQKSEENCMHVNPETANVGAIVGGVIAAVVVVGIVGFIIWRRRKNSYTRSDVP